MTKSASLRSRHTSVQSDWGYCCKSQLRRADFRSVQEMEKWGGYGIEESRINNPPERVENYLIRRWQNPVCGVFERTSRWYCRWSTTKSCFQSANEILCKLRSHGLEEIPVFRQRRISSLILYTDGYDLPRRRVREEIWAKKKTYIYRWKMSPLSNGDILCRYMGYKYFAVK